MHRRWLGMALGAWLSALCFACGGVEAGGDCETGDECDDGLFCHWDNAERIGQCTEPDAGCDTASCSCSDFDRLCGIDAYSCEQGDERVTVKCSGALG